MTNENKSVMAFNLSFLFDQREMLKESMAQLLGWVKEGRLKVTKVTKYPLKEAGRAHKDLESGQTMGKLVLTMDEFELKMSEGGGDKNWPGIKLIYNNKHKNNEWILNFLSSRRGGETCETLKIASREKMQRAGAPFCTLTNPLRLFIFEKECLFFFLINCFMILKPHKNKGVKQVFFFPEEKWIICTEEKGENSMYKLYYI